MSVRVEVTITVPYWETAHEVTVRRVLEHVQGIRTSTNAKMIVRFENGRQSVLPVSEIAEVMDDLGL